MLRSPSVVVQVRDHFLVPPGSRNDIGPMLDAFGNFHVGVELGVQAGLYSEILLKVRCGCAHDSPRMPVARTPHAIRRI